MSKEIHNKHVTCFNSFPHTYFLPIIFSGIFTFRSHTSDTQKGCIVTSNRIVGWHTYEIENCSTKLLVNTISSLTKVFFTLHTGCTDLKFIWKMLICFLMILTIIQKYLPSFHTKHLCSCTVIYLLNTALLEGLKLHSWLT